MKKRGLSLLLALSVAIGLLTVTAGAETQSSEVANFTATTSILYQTHIDENYTGLLVEATGIPANAEYGVEIAVVPVETEGEGVEPTEVAIDAAEVTGTKYPATSDLIAGKYIVDLGDLEDLEDLTPGTSYTAKPYYTKNGETVYAEEFSFTTVAARSSVSSGSYGGYYAYDGNIIAIGYGNNAAGNGGAVDFKGKNGDNWLSSTYGNGGWAYKFGNSNWVETYGPKVSVYKNSDVQVNSPVQAWVVPTTTEDGAFGVLTYYIRNISDTTITSFQFGAAADIEISGNDYAPISKRDYGIIMTDPGTNNAFIMVCREGYYDIPAGKGVNTLWFGGFTEAKSNVFINIDSNDLTSTDSGAAYSWMIDSLAPGEIETFSVLFGVGDADVLEKLINGSVDYEKEQLKELEPSTTYVITTAGGNTYTFDLDAQTTTIPLAGTDKNGAAYNFVGETITITSNAEGSQPQTIIVANRPVAEDPAPPHPTSPLYTTPDAVPPSDVTTDTDSITVTDNNNPAQEYSINGTDWVRPTNGKVVFENLTPGGTYTLKARVPATGNTPVSAPSAGITVETLGLIEIEVTGLSESFTYNEAAQQAAGIIVTAPAEGATIKYAAEASDEYSLEAPPAYTYPGNYTYYYRVEAAGYRPAYGAVSVTVNKKTFDAPDQEATLYYTGGTSVVFEGQVPEKIAENKDHVSVTDNSSYFTVSYDKTTGKITLARNGDLPKTAENVENKTVTIYVSGGESGYYKDYSFDVVVTPDFTILETELPTVSVSENNKLTVTNTNNRDFAFRLVGEGVKSAWYKDATKVFEPLEAGNYEVEICYAGLEGANQTKLEDHITTLTPPITITDVVSGQADLSTSSVTLSASYNDATTYGDDEATYFHHNGAWYKLTTAGKLTAIGGGDSCTNGVNTGAYTFEAFELTLSGAKTSGAVVIPTDSVSIIVDGAVTTGEIGVFKDLDISGKGAAAKNSLTAAGIIATTGDITIKKFNTLNVTGAITAAGDVNIDGNGDAVMNGGKDTNTATSAKVNLIGNIVAGDTVSIDGIKEMFIVCEAGNAVAGVNGVTLNNIDEFGINDKYKSNMTVCDNGIATGANGAITFTEVDKFTSFTGERGLAAKNVTLEDSYGEITVVNTSGDEKAVEATAEFLVIGKGAVAKSGESKNKAPALKLGEKVIGEDTVKAVVAPEDVDVFFAVSRPSGSSAPLVTVPISNDESKVDVTVSVSGKDATINPLNEKQIEQLVGDENASGDVVVDLSNLGRTIDTAGIPKKTLEAIVEAAEDAGNDTEHLVIKLSTAELKLDDAAMRAIVDQANGSIIKFNFDDVGTARLNSKQKDAVKDMDVRKGYEAYITVNGVRISDFKGGNVEIVVPYAVPAGENVAGFSVWYIDEQGNPEKLESTYDGKHKWFVVTHFSDYVIVYDGDANNVANCPKDDTCPIHPFTDTNKQAWYHDGVHYCIDNELMIGVGNNLFAPTGITTRAQIVTILWRMEGSPLVEAAEDFNDVYESDWYYNAIRWASANKVVEGYGNSLFGPNDTITREQVATILWRYCKYKGIDVSVGEETNILSYEDAFDVSDWAMEAMQWACGSGLIQGIEKNNTMYLDPKGNADRSQSATMIYRFCTEIKK